MPDLANLIQQGSANAWLFIPSAILLGALHGLEPGHSKTMMAAFIIAIHGTVRQAILLGLAATMSHTVIVWTIALGGLYLWRGLDAEAVEPYFQLLSGGIIIAIALWMAWRTWRDQSFAGSAKAETPGHAHHDDHAGGDHHSHDGHQDHDHHHDHGGLLAAGDDSLDAHARVHADDIEKRFAGRRNVTTGQVILFGLTGGLIPCPAAITVLLLCLQLKQIPLGAALVLCFSIGLALTLVAVGVTAALALRHAGKRVSWFSSVAKRAPYFSSLLIVLVGSYVAYQGWRGLA